MATQCAYRSRAPGVLEAWRAYENAMHAYFARVDAALREHGRPDGRFRTFSGMSSGEFYGAIPADGDELPGWRKRRSPSGVTVAVPDKRTKAGKAAAAALDACGWPGDLVLPGMPQRVDVPGENLTSRLCTPGVALLEAEAALYVTWSTVLEAAVDWRDRSKPVAADLALWESVPLAQWREAREAEKARQSASEGAA